MTFDGTRVTAAYGGVEMFVGELRGEGAVEFRTLVDTAQNGAITQVVKWTARGGGPLTLTGVIAASTEAFPCEVQPREDGLPVIRHSSGLSHSLLNRAVYDRHADWVLSVDFPATARVVPFDSSAAGTSFRIEATGYEVGLRFRPRFYGRHRGLTAFRPWTYRTWPTSVAGWTSWFAFRDDVTEADILRTADVVTDALAPYGYEYIQIDDGYQQVPAGLPETWLDANDKFPSGLASLSRDIGARGLRGGIWTYVSFHQREWAEAHPEYFVRGPDGRPAYGNWVGWVLDGSNPATLSEIVRPIYRGLKESGWTYFKVDALRHLRYEGYNTYADYFRGRSLDREQVFRGVVQAIRDEIGAESFMLGAWGIRPELAGLLDACRVGDDGFGYGGFAQYNSFNNVVWRNDPDHVELTPADAYRATTATSLTGSLLMLTDRPEVYRTPVVEAARRTAPVLVTRPGQIYDVDPSRSRLIGLAAAEISGAGPRPFDADQAAQHHLYLLEVNRPFERWAVLGRTGGEDRAVPFVDLGLTPDVEYHVFEFWTRTYRGLQRDALEPGPIDPSFNAQAFCLRAALPHPQVIATSRHVSCGGWDLLDVAWDGATLRGRSRLVGGDLYVLYLTEPGGYELTSVTADGAQVVSDELRGTLRHVALRADGNTEVSWTLVYGRR
ncbi:MAG: alpha-galactosidase [Gemmatimonadales bacterium]|nr:alpha-galactosidase [Gemmatimonadales bacterium]